MAAVDGEGGAGFGVLVDVVSDEEQLARETKVDAAIGGSGALSRQIRDAARL